MYILKIYYKSRYFGFKRVEYKEFDDYVKMIIYISEKKIDYRNYQIFSKVVL